MLNPFHIILASLRGLLLVISLVLIIPVYLLLSKFFFENTTARAFRLRRAWVKFAIFILGIKFKVVGEPCSENALYVCNHRSFSDPLIVAAVIDAYVIAKAEVSNLPLISTGAEMTGIIYVKRDDKDSRIAVREMMIKVLLDNKNVLVFPEGTTNGQLTTLPYKKGSFIEAAKNNIKVVPIALEYKKQKDLWYKSGLLNHHFKQFGRLRTEARMHIGPVLSSTDGIAISEKAEQWTNEATKLIHSDWDSHFNKLISQQA